MQGSALSEIILPLVLALIMFGMGLSLTRTDFVRLFKLPMPVFAGLFGQLIALPLLAFCLVLVLSLPAHLAIGIMVLSACPGGTTSNLISHIARANLALSISLTAITTVICVFTTPLIIRFALGYFEVESSHFSLLNTTLGLIAISLFPVMLGLWIRHKADYLAQRLEPVFRHLAVIFMLLLIVGIAWQERDMMIASFPDVFVLTFALNVLATVLGVAIAKLVVLSRRDAVTLGIEIGTQNASMAILITLAFLNEPSYAIACGVYGVTMYIGAFALVWWNKLRDNAMASQ
ncbi:bile acid:sodium symporter family protein [Alteromonas oceanisediminis]|uniref:bile acid:sodium symporter family protein n=1 Tax=Alteromonas oceanisediminis TaxID=2836180 RepID=UPI001BDA9A06|nr:bile acid:sodium symporter family protein [Alteromonas oceanisediminis]MBT0585638.1 bile acid:sodium symporter family protein [Alteromonas oceanisediminis]